MENNKPDVVFLDGFIFKRPREGCPDFVKGEMSIKADEAIAFIQKHTKNGWLNADLLASKDNTKLYFKLNTWEKPVDTAQPPSQAPQASPQAGTNPQDSQDAPAIAEGDIPW